MRIAEKGGFGDIYVEYLTDFGWLLQSITYKHDEFSVFLGCGIDDVDESPILEQLNLE